MNGDDYIEWLSTQEWVKDAEIEALEATAELGQLGMYGSMFDRPEDQQWSDDDLDDLRQMYEGYGAAHGDDPDEMAAWNAWIAEGANHGYTLHIRGDKVYELLEAYSHIFDHDCAWAAYVIDDFVGTAYRVLGEMVLGDDDLEM